MHHLDWIAWISIACAVIAAAILVSFLWRRPALDASTKIFLLFGLGVFPILSAGASNVAGFRAMESRKFCGSCHVMIPHQADSEDANSTSLAAIHGRNPNFGHDNCYTCHADYGMFAFTVTKLGGLKHVYYYLTEYHDQPLEKTRHEIRIAHPLPNSTCMQCHTTKAPRWLQVPDHRSSVEDARLGRVSCASPGCHGYAHPVTKYGKELPARGTP